jgi:hypothetical protein
MMDTASVLVRSIIPMHNPRTLMLTHWEDVQVRKKFHPLQIRRAVRVRCLNLGQMATKSHIHMKMSRVWSLLTLLELANLRTLEV